MRYVLIYILFSSILSGCGVQVAKEAGKAIQSIDTSLKKINIIKKKEDKKIVIQKKHTKIEIVGKSEEQLITLLGAPNFIRNDGTALLMRFDQEQCIAYTFFNNQKKNTRVEYFELRNKKGNILKNKSDINNCLNSITKS